MAEHARRLAVVVVVTLGLALTTTRGIAHKPITSPYTYTEDVFPILREHCGACHRPGGVGPMSLLTHGETVPWGESIRLELLAGHMPPWSVESAPSRFQGIRRMSPRQMDVVLTWATGGTPLGSAAPRPALETGTAPWALGLPDLQLRLPREFVLDTSTVEDTLEVVVPTGLADSRWVRAVDLQPGTPAVVRSATVHLELEAPAATSRGMSDERLLAAWLPGDEPIALPGGAGFELPAAAGLVVRVRYKKTWQNERKEMRDRSTLGLYFADGPAVGVKAVRLAPAASASLQRSAVSFSRTITEDVYALALYPDTGLSTGRVTVSAIGLDGTRRELIDFRPRAGWARRYWFREPVALQRGTRLVATVTPDGPQVLAFSAPQSPITLAGSEMGLTINVIPAR
jgi:mono/diheme cytochrome c family protein